MNDTIWSRRGGYPTLGFFFGRMSAIPWYGNEPYRVIKYTRTTNQPTADSPAASCDVPKLNSSRSWRVFDSNNPANKLNEPKEKLQPVCLCMLSCVQRGTADHKTMSNRVEVWILISSPPPSRFVVQATNCIEFSVGSRILD